MHLLATTPGRIDDGDAAIDLGQTPGEIVVLTAADSEIACLAAAQGRLRGPAGSEKVPTLRLARLLRLQHPYSVDLYVDGVVARARLVVLRLLGGRGYWPYGLDRIVETCRTLGIALACLPGDDREDPDLLSASTLPEAAVRRLWGYLAAGGIGNAEQCLRYAASLCGRAVAWREPEVLPPAGLYWPGLAAPVRFEELVAGWRAESPVAALLFYRALVQAGNLAPVDALIAALEARRLAPLPLYASSLKDPAAASLVRGMLAAARPAVILNTTGFALASPDDPEAGRGLDTPFAGLDAVQLQVVLSGGTEAGWREGSRGLAPRDLAMSVVLPEVDGRVLAGAVSFKAEPRRDPETEAELVAYAPVADRIERVAALAGNWARLRATPSADRRVALVLANYPIRDGRLANGVGLDTPASAVAVLHHLARAGYRTQALPADGNALIRALQAGPTNAGIAGRRIRETLDADAYRAGFALLPAAIRDAVTLRWGPPDSDRFFLPGRDAFAIPALRLGHVAVLVQPTRGYDVDPEQSVHDPALPPPHGYLAAYLWLTGAFAAHAVVHLGKHGTLEWLPGKSVALSEECFPDAVLPPLPHLYPFIVNDPGEGTQAKRRSAAVIVDHLTPPLTRAGSYGALQGLEQRIDEYYEAAALDPRRLKPLARDILELAAAARLDADCGIAPEDDDQAALAKLDAFLCDVKALQIRDGLHVFGTSPRDGLRSDLLLAITRTPRGSAGAAAGASLLRALADDLRLGFDPLLAEPSAPWTGPRPAALAAVSAEPWRCNADTAERLEALARRLLEGAAMPAGWTCSRAVLGEVADRIAPALDGSGAAELAGLLRGLDGRFVAPGPSGAPSRGRPEVLPTGRNFYSVDTRAVPTPSAWRLGWAAAGQLMQRHAEAHGDWPRRVAISAWGTAAMRTGGDDIAQALALIGARPAWDDASGRVTGFEILPVSVLDRPRVDVTLRVSGLFRDAFPALIDLFDSAARAVAGLDEPAADNPLAERVRIDAAALQRAGMAEATARRQAGWRVFGSRPGAYGAGLQGPIDSGAWTGSGDLADAYLAWSGWAYGGGTDGTAARASLEQRLAGVEAVIHNQDNREHDILDSDDYYQFQGGLAVAVRHLSGRAPAVWHGDHALPEAPRLRGLDEEIARTVRGRAANPRWIAGAMRHGYKGGFEMAATVDYLFAFAATTGLVGDQHFDALCDAYLRDGAVQEFLAAHNPEALREMADRFLEAQRRGLWRPRANDTLDLLQALATPNRESSP